MIALTSSLSLMVPGIVNQQAVSWQWDFPVPLIALATVVTRSKGSHSAKERRSSYHLDSRFARYMCRSRCRWCLLSL